MQQKSAPQETFNTFSENLKSNIMETHLAIRDNAQKTIQETQDDQQAHHHHDLQQTWEYNWQSSSPCDVVLLSTPLIYSWFSLAINLWGGWLSLTNKQTTYIFSVSVEVAKYLHIYIPAKFFCKGTYVWRGFVKMKSQYELLIYFEKSCVEKNKSKNKWFGRVEKY